MIAEFHPAPLRHHVPQNSPAKNTTLRLGYLPLTDAAPLLVAQEKGFFARHGVRVELSRHTAWAGLRDRIAAGALDGAQLLAPMPIALSLGLGGPRRDMSVVATLSRNGNTIVLSREFMSTIAAFDEAPQSTTTLAFGLAATLAQRRRAGSPPPVFAVVFPFSSHAYLLRYWLAAAGIVPERDVRLVALPPSQVVEHLAEGVIAGFCAGEPWGSRAVELGVGHIALPSSAIWSFHPEKMLAFPTDVDAQAMTDATAALIEAGRWADDPANREETVRLLCREALPGLPAELVRLILDGGLVFDPWADIRPVDRMIFAEGVASFPALNQAGWYVSQMARWGHLPPEADQATLGISEIWRPDLWAKAAHQLNIPVPDEASFTVPDGAVFGIDPA